MVQVNPVTLRLLLLSIVVQPQKRLSLSGADSLQYFCLCVEGGISVEGQTHTDQEHNTDCPGVGRVTDTG